MNDLTWGAVMLRAQVTAHYVAMTPNGRVFDSSLDRGFPYDIRVGSGQVRRRR
jgi:FKBP-type peptidyl-prolyl cis-trans isomerase